MPGAIQLSDLPTPGGGRTRWPWTEAPAPELAARAPAGVVWPRVTVVTPSYNQGQYLEETIRSVLLQGYPNLEYLVLDGGSTDDSAAIIRRYAPWLDYWVTAPDGGQSQAINVGFRRATGQVLAWLNSDDSYLPGALLIAAAALQADSTIQLVYGSANFVDAAGVRTGPYEGRPLPSSLARMAYWRGWPVPQPSLFFKSQLLAQFGYLDETYHYAMDYEWLLRVWKPANFKCLPQVLANYRLHALSKSGGTGDWDLKKTSFYRECRRANHKYAPMTRPYNWPLWFAEFKYRLKTRMQTAA